MTHDELLFKIYEIHNNSSDAGQESNKQYKGMIQFMQALRAVVELHKPQPTTIPNDPKCAACSDLDWCDYPCATIRAIEKELI